LTLIWGSSWVRAVGTALGAVVVMAWPVMAGAQSSPTLAGIDISPVYQSVTLGADEPAGHYVVTLTNKTGVDQAFKLSTVDFGSLNESGGVAFLGVSSSDFAQKYGLSPWMQLDQTALTLAPGSSADITVTVTNSAALRSGGHYGAVLATALTAPNDPAAASRVGVMEVLSSLILLVKGGGPPPTLALVAQDVQRASWGLPDAVTDRFHNEGATHVVPRGVVEVHDPVGRLVARGALNEDSGIILPQNFRRYVTPLVQLAAARWPGRYRVVTTYRYDGSNARTQYVSSFWYLGAAYVWISVVVLMALVAAAGGWWLVWRKRKSRRARRF